MKAPEVHASVRGDVALRNYDAVHITQWVWSLLTMRGVPELASCVYVHVQLDLCRASAISQLDYNIDIQAGYLSSYLPISKTYS